MTKIGGGLQSAKKAKNLKMKVAQSVSCPEIMFVWGGTN